MSFYNEKIIKKPAKVHRCTGCCKKMPTNRRHYYAAGKVDGDFFSGRLCFACRRFMKKHRNDFEEGYTDGDVRDARRDFAKAWIWSRKQKAVRP